MFRRNQLYGFGFLFLMLSCTQPERAFELKTGDILFQDLDCGPFCESIEVVTPGIDGAELSHCGIVFRENDQLKVIEAGGKGVVITPVDSFLTRARDGKAKPKVLVGRMKEWNETQLTKVVALAKTYLGQPYDEVFDLENEAMYCSELVYRSYLDANDQPVFNIGSMTFNDPKTGDTFPLWASYFSDLGVEVPEGKPGLNPGSISLSDKVKIVHAYGFPENYKPGQNSK